MNRDQLYNDPEEAFRIGFEGGQSDLWTAMPGIVQSVDWSTMTCSVQPAIKATTTDNNGIVQAVNLPILINVPICFPQAGGFALTFPMIAGDEVLVVWACRCIDAWWQSGGVQIPMEARMHDISDGFAIPGVFSKPNVFPSIATDQAELRNKDGTARIGIKSDGTININAAAGINMMGPVSVTGTIMATGEITSGLIPLSVHVHTGVTPGSGSSGPPAP